MLNIYEFDHNSIPGAAKDYFEVYQENDITTPLFISESLDKVTSFCYDMGENFTINTLQAYYKEYGAE